LTPEELAVVAAAEEAGLLAVRPSSDRQPGRCRFRARCLLRLRAERKLEAIEQTRVEAGEHVALVLRLVGRPGEEEAAVALDDARIVAGRQLRGADPPREREELGEPEAPVAADARVRRLAACVAAHERRDDGATELVA